jgi:hypothetical protein
MIYAVIVGHLYQFTYSIVGLITSICMIFIGLMMIYITPQLRNNLGVLLMKRDNRVHTRQTLQQHLTLPTTSTGRQNAPLQQIKSTSKQRQTVL